MKRADAIRAGLLAIAAEGLFLAPPACAASERYVITWMIDPVPPAREERTVKPGDVVTEARLLPPSLLVIDGTAVRTDGKIAASSGTQMMTLQASLRSACTFTFPPTSVLQLLMGAKQKFACFVDADNDGRFESMFTAASSEIGVPSSYGKIPNRRTPITPLPYRQIPLSDGKDFPKLVFKYSHQDLITGHAYFGICIVNSSVKNESCFDGYSGVRSDKLPKEIGAGGNLALATAKQGDSVTLTVKSGFTPMPFRVTEYIRWVFY